MQDLWADFVGAAIPTEESGRGGGLRQRRLSEQAVLNLLRSWLLQDYLIPYATSLGAARIFQRCYWIDGLGNLDTSKQTIPPPIQEEPANKRGRKKAPRPETILPPALQPVANIARQLALLDRPIALYGFILDNKSGRRKAVNGTERAAQKVVQALDATTLPKEGGLLPFTWPELAPALLAMLEQSAAVLLLNPLKERLFRSTDLLPLYQRAAPTELFLCLSHKQIETRLLPALRVPEEAAAFTKILRSDRWKSLLVEESKAASPETAINGLVDLLAESMKPHFLSVQRLAFPVHTGPALVEQAPYSLLFATRRLDSLCSLNDAVCCHIRRLLIASQQGLLNEVWFTTQRAEQSVKHREMLYQETLALGQTQRIRRWPDLRQQLLLAHFGRFTQQEYDQIILSLLARGAVRCEWRKRNGESVERSVPGNEDLLLWH